MREFMCNRCGVLYGIDKRTTIIKSTDEINQYCPDCVLQYYAEEIKMGRYTAEQLIAAAASAGEEGNEVKKHPGFKAVQNRIAKKQGISKKSAGAILASAGRKASKKAKRKNPRLKRIA